MFHLLLILQIPNKGHSFQENPVTKQKHGTGAFEFTIFVVVDAENEILRETS